MHPRNPYLTKRPDFAALAKNHVFLAPFVTTVRGNGHIDFKNKDAIRALSRALLLEDFQLNVVIPLDSLVPVIPQRLNYVLWIEDFFKGVTDVRGLDIGTGGSAIYALLCARKNNWKMVGTDIQPDSIDFARKNVERNQLSDLVQDEETESLGKSRNLGRPPPFAAQTGTSTELVAVGGEIEFLHKMITDSKRHPDTVGIFTTMVGIKADLKFLKELLKANQVVAQCTTSFVQGKTMRWGLAWTFDSQYAPLLQSSAPAQAPKIRPVKCQLTCSCSPTDFVNTIKRMLDELKFVAVATTSQSIEVKGATNTWSKQRLKRRAASRGEPDDLDGKRLRTVGETERNVSTEAPSASVGDPAKNSNALELKLAWNLSELGNPKVVEATHLGGTLGIDGIHQVIQYFRNAYTKHNCIPAQTSGNYINR